MKAADMTGIREVAIAGGVAANSCLRNRLKAMEASGWKVYIPEFEYCMDNAAMIGITGYYKYLNDDFSDLTITPDARLQL
jgi:N6-L-threonylcarbamoyladenine synthase